MNNKSKIQVICPMDNIPEREYSINSVFSFIELDYDLAFDENAKDYHILAEGKTLIIEDHFWKFYQEPLSYLSNKNLPTKSRPFSKANNIDLPIIYGRDFLLHQSNCIICGLDIFASSFFMLSRWEEYVISQKNGRCDESALFSVKNNIYRRPIVNEYCDLLITLLLELGVSTSPMTRKKEVLLTHDVDRCYLSSFEELLVNLGYMILKDKNILKPLLTLKRFLQYKISRRNPFDTFDLLMTYSEQYNLKNAFFFKACNKSELGYTYDIEDKFVKDTIARIESRGHCVGFHPSENALDNEIHFMEELARLHCVSRNMRMCSGGGRSHGLHYSIDYFSLWDKAGLIYDSGCGFQYRNGFRSGVCYSYSVFDIKSRKRLNLLETPFFLMDSVWLRTKTPPMDFYYEAVNIIDLVFKYNGTLCLNWHSNLINSIEMKPFRYIYFKIVDYISNCL